MYHLFTVLLVQCQSDTGGGGFVTHARVILILTSFCSYTDIKPKFFLLFPLTVGDGKIVA